MSDLFDAFESTNNFNGTSTDTPINPINGFDDPAADFLAQEQVEFAKIESNDFTADNFGDFSNVNSAPSNFGSNDPFSLETTETVLSDAKNTNDFYSAISSVDRLSNEPEKLKTWREENKIRLENKDSEEEKKKKEWKEAAKKELEDWYKNRQDQLTKTHSNNKTNNKAAEADLVGTNDQGNEAERVAKLCDFNPKSNKNTKDVSRMRSILLQLKQQPLVR